MKRRVKAKTIAGFVFFAVVSNFLHLYIICFCHVANQRMSRDWARSSGISVVMDLFVLETAPALIFANLALLFRCCKSSRAILCCLVVIEVYRLYRNLIEA